MAFTSSDCDVFRRYKQSVNWASVSSSDQHQFKDIRRRLKELAEALASRADARLRLKAEASLPTPNGRSPREIWCCVYPEVVPNKSYGLQIALIISERGAEACFCMGAGKSQVKEPQHRAKLEDVLTQARLKLDAVPTEKSEQIESALKRKWFYRRSWLQTPNQSDFSNLDEWLKYAASTEGASASVSIYFTPDELEALGDQIKDVFNEVYESYKELLLMVYVNQQIPATLPNNGTDVSVVAFKKLMQHYQSERIVFRSSVQSARYAIESVDDNGVNISRLDSEEPERLTFSHFLGLLQKIKKAGGRYPFTDLDRTAAIRNTMLQADTLGLSADRTQVVDLADKQKLLENFCELISALNVQEIYKPAMLACIIEAIDEGSLQDNRITFDWVTARFITKMAELGREVSPAQSAMAFFHLTSELFWLHAANDLSHLMNDGREGPAAAREKVRYACFKEPYWTLLQDLQSRQRVLQVLNEKWLRPKTPPENGQKTNPQDLIELAIAALEQSGLVQIEHLAARLIVSCLAKPFVILTGTSGTGKTRLAHHFAKWLVGNDGYEVVPVGADWTDNRSVVGFVNHLRPGDDGRPTYAATPILQLLLRAQREPTRPFFLILDEMNLSHVERYFSDFLSAMESRKPVPIHREGRPLLAADGTPVSASVPFPDNLFVIGTVNVDETTYMFSPKVLDRANVIEFSTTAEAIGAFLEAGGNPPAGVGPAPTGFAELFLKLSLGTRGLSTQPLLKTEDEAPLHVEEVSKVVQQLFTLLHKARFEFGFRTASEIMRYMRADYVLTTESKRANWSWQGTLDIQILQKILPKLHGSRNRIGPLLCSLATYCQNQDFAGACAFFPTDGNDAERTLYDFEPEVASATFNESYRKLCTMIRTVEQEQFVSFIQ